LKGAVEICYAATSVALVRESTRMLPNFTGALRELFAGCLLTACLSSANAALAAAAASAVALDGRPPSFAAIAKKTTPVVVNIFTTTQRSARGGGADPLEDFFNRFFGDTQPRENSPRSLGSGILISKD